MSLDTAMFNLKKMGSSLTFERACKELAEKNGVDVKNDEAMGAYFDKTFGPIFEKALPTDLNDSAKQLLAYRNAVGEDMWGAIAQNPSLPQLLKDWVDGRKKKVVDGLVNDIQQTLEGTSITDEQVKEYVYFQLMEAPQ